MSVQIALLRVVNVRGGKLAMADLKAACLAAGCEEARTLLASGNVVVRAKASGAALEKKLEAALAAKTGLKTDFYVRSRDELDAAISANPYAAMAKADPSHLVLYFMKAAPTAADAKAALAPQDGPEQMRLKGAQGYIAYPDGIGRSKFKVRLEGTMRNWNTVLKLAAMADEMEAA